MPINFVTFSLLNRLLIENLHRIPRDVEVVVGVPRSGLLLANMIACQRNKPLTDVLNAAPKFIPSRPVGWIVTARPQKYVEETQFWLRKNGVDYGALIMLGMDSAEERRRLNIHAEFKAQVYSALQDAALFIESNPAQAQVIAQLSRKDVFCPEAGITYTALGGARLSSLLWQRRERNYGGLRWSRQFSLRRALAVEWAAA